MAALYWLCQDSGFVPSGVTHSAEVVGTEPVVSVDAPRG
jgi:hypothetical protein